MLKVSACAIVAMTETEAARAAAVNFMVSSTRLRGELLLPLSDALIY
jgi:hypothetical protein